MIVFNEDKESLVIPNGLGEERNNLMPIVELKEEEYNSLKSAGNVKNNVVYLIKDV